MGVQILLDRLDDLRREPGQFFNFIQKITEIRVWNRQNEVAKSASYRFCSPLSHMRDLKPRVNAFPFLTS